MYKQFCHEREEVKQKHFSCSLQVGGKCMAETLDATGIQRRCDSLGLEDLWDVNRNRVRLS